MLVGFTGYATSGKDAAAKFLLGFRRMAFAEQLRSLALEIDPYFPETMRSYKSLVEGEGYDNAKKRPYVRKFLISLGAGVRKHIHPDAWVTALFSQYDPEFSTVITDVRYLNEAKEIKNRKGIVIKIVRPGVSAISEEENKSIALIEPDFIVENNGTLEELEQKVLQVLRDWHFK